MFEGEVLTFTLCMPFRADKGKMSEFVKLQPQAKHYFELATTDMLKFDFPEPGRLEGVKTSTQKFLELENVDFRYPGADRNQLTDVNLKMTLSSRVVVLGAVSLDIMLGCIVSTVFVHTPSDLHYSTEWCWKNNAYQDDCWRNCPKQYRRLSTLHSPESPCCVRRAACFCARRATHGRQPCFVHPVAL